MAKTASNTKVGLCVLSKLAVTFFHPNPREGSSAGEEKSRKDTVRVKELVARNSCCSQNSWSLFIY